MLKDLSIKLNPEMIGNHTDDRKLFGHIGTHFDVMNKEFPLEYTRRKAIVFDVRDIREIGLDDIDIDRIEKDMFVGFCSGFIEKYAYGTPVYTHEHPELSEELIEALLAKEISIIGIDFAGVRRGSQHTPMDQYCADRGVFIVENLCNLSEVIGTCIINTYPLNFTGASGLPCRVVAEI